MSKVGILIIEDEPQIQKMLEISLESHQYKVSIASNAKEGIIMASNHPPELILLDIGLPDKNGQVVLQELRQWFQKPIIMLSVKNGEEDIVRALDNGATDYLVKPFRMGELLARIRSSLKRSFAGNTSSVMAFGGLQIDLVARVVKIQDKIVKLTSTEYQLLTLFAQNEGRVLTHQYILKEIWGIGFQTETQYLRVFVGQLRKKIEENPNRPTFIVTESGVGYRFC